MTGSTTPIDRAQRMRAAMAPVLEAGPEFLAGRREADDMARTMVAAALAAAEGEVEAGEAGDPEERTPSPEVVADTRRLQAAWEEIHTCGSGYLAGRCDAACVGRTVTWLVDTFGNPGDGATS